ncbi:hypothetical protein FQZ97_762750 [compost metagenome]
MLRVSCGVNRRMSRSPRSKARRIDAHKVVFPTWISPPWFRRRRSWRAGRTHSDVPASSFSFLNQMITVGVSGTVKPRRTLTFSSGTHQRPASRSTLSQRALASSTDRTQVARRMRKARAFSVPMSSMLVSRARSSASVSITRRLTGGRGPIKETKSTPAAGLVSIRRRPHAWANSCLAVVRMRLLIVHVRLAEVSMCTMSDGCTWSTGMGPSLGTMTLSRSQFR